MGGVNLTADLVTVTKSASQEICTGVNLPADLVTVIKSASNHTFSLFTFKGNTKHIWYIIQNIS